MQSPPAIARPALAALAALALAGTPLAAEARAGDGGDARAGSRKAAVAVSVLPPPRPDEPSSGPAAAEESQPAAAATESSPAPALRGALAEPAAASAPIIPPPLPPLRPAFRHDDAAAAAVAAVEPTSAPQPAAPAPAPGLLSALFSPRPAEPDLASAAENVSPSRARLNQLIAHHARLHGVPEALVHRVVVRESRYNPRAVGRGGAMGLMQIKAATARGLGYSGGPAGLLDAETNLTYAVPYLAGAYRTAGGNHDRAVGYYARGYYYAAKRMGLSGSASRGRTRDEPAPTFTTAPAAAAPPVVAVAADDRYAR